MLSRVAGAFHMPRMYACGDLLLLSYAAWSIGFFMRHGVHLKLGFDGGGGEQRCGSR